MLNPLTVPSSIKNPFFFYAEKNKLMNFQKILTLHGAQWNRMKCQERTKQQHKSSKVNFLRPFIPTRPLSINFFLWVQDFHGCVNWIKSLLLHGRTRIKWNFANFLSACVMTRGLTWMIEFTVWWFYRCEFSFIFHSFNFGI